MNVLATRRLSLRELVPADADELLRIFGDQAAMTYAPMDVTQDRAVALAAIEWHRDNYRRFGYSAWAVVGREGEFIGLAGLLPHHVGIELFCSIVRSEWGHGYATEVLTACRELAFERLGIDRLIAILHPEHVRAIAVARKLGMSEVGEITYWNRLNRMFELRKRQNPSPEASGEIEMRAATEADAELVYAIKREAYTDSAIRAYGSWDEAFHRRFTREILPHTRLLIVDGAIIGWLAVRHASEESEIVELHLLPAHQRKGYGRQVIRAVINEAGSKPVTLSVLKINPARSLYERLGFIVTGETVTHVLMRLPSDSADKRPG